MAARMSTLRLFLCGDVMLARGVDMVQKYSCDPKLFEGSSLTAYDYVRLAENANGAMPPASERGIDYVWGDAIGILQEKNPDLRIINLETAVTTSPSRWRGKAIHYRMHPKNIDIIKSAQIDCCVLSNNHTADWGYEGLGESLDSLQSASIGYTGAGRTLSDAELPCVMQVPGKGRVIVYGIGDPSSGIPLEWAAKKDKYGLHVLTADEPSVRKLKTIIKRSRKDDDVTIVSVHVGDNWGFSLEKGWREFAHGLIDKAGVDIIHGHSSHHVKAIEKYKGKLIMYGCGDFINDYEGIGGYEEFKGDLSLMYFVDLDAKTGDVREVRMVPTTMKKLQVKKVEREEDIDWLHRTLYRECKKYGTEIAREGNEILLK